MNNFEYYAPTRVIFGKDTENQVGQLIAEQQGQTVLVHFGGGSVQRSGLLDRVYASLEKAGLKHVSLGGVVPNPRLSKVREGIELCRKEKVDFLLAVGGGSVIDSAKAIGYGLAYDGDVWDFYCGKAQPQACFPVGTILTIAAAGSEMSNSSVITNEDGWLKRGCTNDHSRCKFAIMNPELTATLPPYQTASGCADILMHSMERYFSPHASMELTDSISEALMRTVIRNARILVKDPANYNARAEIMWASSLSHNDLTGHRSLGDWACHQLEHELSGIFDVAHGAGLAAIWGSWARYVQKTNPARFAQFAVNVLGIANNFASPDNTSLAGIKSMENFYTSIGMPTSLKELGLEVSDAQIDELAYKCSFEGKRTIGAFQVLQQEDMKNIFLLARG